MPVTAERPAAQRLGRNYNFWFDPEIAAAIEAFRKDQEIAMSYTSFFEAASKAFLRAKGYWPPRPPE